MDWENPDRRAERLGRQKLPSLRGETPGRDSILGCIEELGELTHSHLSVARHPWHARGHDTAAKDAIGDLIVYLLGVANAHIDPNTRSSEPDKVGLTDEDHLLWLTNAVSLMVIYDMMGRSSRRGVQAIGRVIYYAAAYARAHDWNFEDIVHDSVGARQGVEYLEQTPRRGGRQARPQRQGPPQPHQQKAQGAFDDSEGAFTERHPELG